MKTSESIILATLDRINKAIESDPNAILSVRDSGPVTPEADYIALVAKLLNLAK